MIQNSLLNSCQSGFRPNDSFINQLISITDNIYRAFDANSSLEVRCVFFQIYQKHLTKSNMKVFYTNLKTMDKQECSRID